MEERLKNTINFIRTMYIFATESKDKCVTLDAETLDILLELLKECKDALFLNENLKYNKLKKN